MAIWNDLSDLFLPRICCMCGHRLGANERYICNPCLMHLPYTYYHTVEHNLLEKQFWGVFPIEKAVALFHHDGARTRRIIYNIKYWGRPKLATHLASMYAQELKDEHFFDDIDCIIPLPLHWRKQLKRGYNQSHYIAQGIRQVTGLPIYYHVVKREENNPSQTHLNAHERQENVRDVFRLTYPEKIAGLHVLLVDDVTTTGATLASCAKELVKAPQVKVSILTLAVASRTPMPASQDDTLDPSSFGLPLME
ncbi:MAG: ComF family protein [Bacteroidaceae bacterium]|nr:ComF family protein [Bacteroidaceae bacterium]